MKKYLMALLFVLYANTATAQYLTSEVGGFVGLATIGAGTTAFDDLYDTSLILGFVPELVGGENLWSLTWKNNIRWNIHLTDVTYTPIYGGANLIASFDKDTFWLLPSRYPEGYYPPSGLFISPNIGTEVRWGKHSVFLEFTTLDFYLEAYGRNSDYLSLQDIFTYGIGYKYSLE